jgi:UDPglucose 6-dehydrogenase
MNIGFLGLGKLGLPVALAIESKGHRVLGTDVNDLTLKNIRFKTLNYREEGAAELLKNSKIELKNISQIVEQSDIIFVPIQTPHEEKYEGITRIPEERADFNYQYLINGIKELNDEIEKQGKDKVVIIISTVLPGTITKYIKPILGTHLKLCYNPFFIAMGTTINDFLKSEIILFGVDNEKAAIQAEEFYKTINNSPFFKTTVENAELIKVVYNTFISTKILGSPSILLKNILEEKGQEVVMWDPWVDDNDVMKVKDIYKWDQEPQLFFIGTKHEAFKLFFFMKDSVVIDPFRYLKTNDNVKYIPIGKHESTK